MAVRAVCLREATVAWAAECELLSLNKTGAQWKGG